LITYNCNNNNTNNNKDYISRDKSLTSQSTMRVSNKRSLTVNSAHAVGTKLVYTDK